MKYADDYHDTDSVQYTYDEMWDSEKIMGCVCDYPYVNYDCSERECPTGDDPLTTGQVNEVQIVECTCLAVCSGSFRLRFRGELSPPIPHYATAERLRHELEKMGTIGGGVTVALFGAGAAGSAFVCDADGARRRPAGGPREPLLDSHRLCVLATRCR